jgi:type IV secretory pathway VirJ component
MAGAPPRERTDGVKRLLLAVLILPLLLAAASPGTVEETKTLPGFGAVTVYRPKDLAKARGVVLFISGDGGWKLGVIDMARRIDENAIVAGLSMPAWQKRAEAHAGTCWYPAGELEVAAQALEKMYKLPRYVRPILVGYSSGATVVYGALAQAPPTTFRGAVSLGFCPDLEVKRPFCGSKIWKPGWNEKKKQSWLPEYPGMTEPEGGGTRWIALQGLIDQVCAPPQTVEFVGKVPHSTVISLEKVGHGFSVPSRWGAAFDRSVVEMLEAKSILEPMPHTVRQDVGHAPPVDVTAKLESLGLPLEVSWPQGARTVVVFVSGDGGWADLDESVAKGLVSRGVAVVGWNTLRYFWLAKTPAVFATDLSRVVRALPDDAAVFAGGYSFGAETVPVVVAGAADPGLARISGLTLLAPGPYAAFEVSPLDWIRTSAEPTAHPVAAAIERAGRPVLCLEPEDDSSSGCPQAALAGYTRSPIPGGHHFGSEYDALAARIATFISASAPHARL